MASPIASVLPTKARSGAYAVFGLLAMFSAAIHLAFSSIGRSTPLWLTVVSVAVTLLATTFAVVAGNGLGDDDDFEEQRRLARRERGDVAVHAVVEPKFVL